MKTKFFLLLLINLVLLFSGGNLDAQIRIGEKLPVWSEGNLDIHHINTGKGDATFMIFPDGTTMLIDAGESHRPPSPREAAAKPNSSRTPGEWISRYISNILYETKMELKLDYILLTHFHGDHMGGVHPDNKQSQKGNYELSGITEVGENIRFKKIIDRDYPLYNWPSPMNNATMQNYKNFIEWHIINKEMQAEKFNVGRNDQITLVNNPNNYQNFEIRNIAANGYVWTGVDENVRNHFPPIESIDKEDYPDENMLCTAIRLSYGRFDYFTGGDLVGIPAPGDPVWHDIETPIGYVVGPVEVNVTNHHAHFNAQNENFIRSLRPRVHIIQSWVVNHPAPSTLGRLVSSKLYSGPRDIFTTNMMEETKIFIGTSIEKIIGQQGHIVIRVEPNGEKFNIFMLDDFNEDFRIKSIHGPYVCE